ncbi:MAG: hypothetical protein ABF379_05915 [Akkermansiaceae bacterium]
MSILACLIGILTLMISVMMQVQQMKKAGRTEEEMALAMENRDLTKKAAILVKENDDKKEKLEREKATVSAMAKLKDRKIALTMELEGLKKAGNKSRSDAELQKQVENMRKEIVAIKEERPPLAKRLKQLEDELKKRKEKPKPKGSVKVQPRGILGGGADVVFFVECNSTGIVLLDAQGGEKKISTAAIKMSGVYAKYLDRVKKTEDSMVLFLIRKAGNEAYRWAVGSAEVKYKLPTGKLPLPNDGEIDLSLFKKN